MAVQLTTRLNSFIHDTRTASYGQYDSRAGSTACDNTQQQNGTSAYSASSEKQRIDSES